MRASEDRKVRGTGTKRVGEEEGKSSEGCVLQKKTTLPERVHSVGSSIEHALRDPATRFFFLPSNRAAAPKSRSQASSTAPPARERLFALEVSADAPWIACLVVRHAALTKLQYG